MDTLLKSRDTSTVTSKSLGTIEIFERRLRKLEELKIFEGIFPEDKSQLQLHLQNTTFSIPI